ncbi:hypothetical protein DACRYDRAFT_109962 [Dacryopinax primogenitus]|uniref:Uncharacterized protein n=1 Tax=Dacryopinax primogenitus (strain DJM 731) TaxID=1858805 RepID=M5G656_DACPD|nr:uncharacterized protein DACRYDRAFT_109962 [Dacryopinax primogenitus]EJT99242.1 hypothetical protein DACRYDRAFT_109962 [Dacryopinax primogenitus]
MTSIHSTHDSEHGYVLDLPTPGSHMSSLSTPALTEDEGLNSTASSPRSELEYSLPHNEQPNSELYSHILPDGACLYNNMRSIEGRTVKPPIFGRAVSSRENGSSPKNRPQEQEEDDSEATELSSNHSTLLSFHVQTTCQGPNCDGISCQVKDLPELQPLKETKTLWTNMNQLQNDDENALPLGSDNPPVSGEVPQVQPVTKEPVTLEGPNRDDVPPITAANFAYTPYRESSSNGVSKPVTDGSDDEAKDGSDKTEEAQDSENTFQASSVMAGAAGCHGPYCDIKQSE